MPANHIHHNSTTTKSTSTSSSSSHTLRSNTTTTATTTTIHPNATKQKNKKYWNRNATSQLDMNRIRNHILVGILVVLSLSSFVNYSITQIQQNQQEQQILLSQRQQQQGQQQQGQQQGQQQQQQQQQQQYPFIEEIHYSRDNRKTTKDPQTIKTIITKIETPEDTYVDRLSKAQSAEDIVTKQLQKDIANPDVKEVIVDETSYNAIIHSDNNNNNNNNQEEEATLVIDMISISNTERSKYSQAQKSTFGRNHTSRTTTHNIPYQVRNFFVITEDDDYEDHCSTTLRMDDIRGIAFACTPRKPSVLRFPFLRKLRMYYAKISWLKAKKDPFEWMCRQKRPVAGLQKIVTHYQTELHHLKLQQEIDKQQHQQQPSSSLEQLKRIHVKQQQQILPDFLFILEDDTYYNMDKVVNYLKQITHSNSNIPIVEAGCIYRYRVNEITFTTPSNGHGMMLSRGVLNNMMIPLYCSAYGAPQREQADITDSTAEDGSTSSIDPITTTNEKYIYQEFEYTTVEQINYVETICDQLKLDRIGEYTKIFRNWMTLADLIFEYVKANRYKDRRLWITDPYNIGYCFHSEWIWGYFFNYYNTTIHRGSRQVIEDRMNGYNQSESYAGKQSKEVKAKRKQCDNTGNRCTPESHVCGKVSPELMHKLYNNN